MEVRALLKFRSIKPIEVKGIGVIVGSNLILTCAHNLLYKWNKYDERKEACEVKVKIPRSKGWITVDHTQWMIPQEFR